MDFDRRLREAISQRVVGVTASDDAWELIQGRLKRHRWRSLASHVALAVFVLGLTAGTVTWLWIAFRPDPFVRPASPDVSSYDLQPRVSATVDVGLFPSNVAIGQGDVWAAVPAQDPESPDAVIRIDSVTNEVAATIPVEGAGDIGAGAGAVWVVGVADDGGAAVQRINPQTNQVVTTIPLGVQYDALRLSVSSDALWINLVDRRDQTHLLARLDPATNEITATIPVDTFVTDLIVEGGAVWVLGSEVSGGTVVGDGDVIRVDPSTNRVVARIPAHATSTNLAVGGGYVWVGSSRGNRPVAVRIDAATDAIVGDPIPVDGGFDPIAADARHVWFWGSDSPVARPTVSFLNARTLQVEDSVRLDVREEPVDVAPDVQVGQLWVANYKQSVLRIDLH